MQILVRLAVLASVIAAVWVAAAALRAYFERGRVPVAFDPHDASNNGGGKPILVEFTSPYCYECREALPVLKAASIVYGTKLTVIDARERPDLVAKYEIRHTPTILVVDRGGSVQAGWTGIPASDELESALRAVSSAGA